MTIRGAGNSIGTAMRSWRRAPWMIFILYPAAWPALYSLSSAYWFLPAGMRVAALWATPMRFWPGLALAEWAGILITSPVFPVFDDLVPAIGGTLVPWLIYAVVVREVRQYAARSDGDASTHALSYAVVAGLVGAAANGLFLVGLRWLDDETVTHPVQLFLTFAFGDYAGIMTLVPLVVMALDKRDPVAKRTRRMRYALALLPSLGVGLTLLPGLGIPTIYNWVFVTVPLTVIGATRGRRAAVAALALVSCCFLAVAHGAFAAWPAEEIQRIFAVAATAALLLGTRRDAMLAQRIDLSRSIEELQYRTQALRDAATRLSAQREAESRRVGLELHVEIGQDMTALATRLRLAERLATTDGMRAELELLRGMVAEAHGHLRNVIRRLHPIALERFGLERALAAGPLAEIAADAGVAYTCAIRGDVAPLPLDIATGVYRISQEAVTNGVRHGCGGEIHVQLDLQDTGAGRELQLSISDAQGAIDVPAQPDSLGLQGIRDRANALGATYHFSASSGRPRHWMRLVLAPVTPHAGRVDGFDAGNDASGTGRGFPFPPIEAPRRPAGWPLD